MLDLHRLRLLRELEARATVSAVAAALGYTTSAVSQQLAVLEREAGAKLLERVGRNVQLTDAGRVLARHAQGLLDAAEAAEAEVAQVAAGQVAGTVRVSSFQSAFLRIVAPSVRALADSHPRIRVEAGELEVEQGVPALRLQHLDVVVGDEYDDQPRPVHRDLVPHRPGPRAGPPGAAAGPPARPASQGAAGRARRPAVGRLPAGHGSPRDADPHLPPARRLRARPPLRLRRLPDPARAGPHDRSLRAAARARPGLRGARRGRARPGRGQPSAGRCTC